MKKLLFVLSVFLLFSCSSTDKRSMADYTIRNQASSDLDLATKNILCARYSAAKKNLDSAYQKALSVDDSSLLCMIDFSYISYELSQGTDEQAVQKAKDHLAEAKWFASVSGLESLKEIARLYEARILLAENDFAKALSIAEENPKVLEKDYYYKAFRERLKGDIYKARKNYDSAEDAYKKAIELHTKNRYLVEIGLDWYKLAQVNSLKGDKNKAIESMENAIKYDRDAENSVALGLDYHAYGLILVKGKPSKEEIQKALKSWEYSNRIFDAADLPDYKEMNDSKIEQYSN